MNSRPSSGPHTPPRDDQESSNIVARAAALGISSDHPISDITDSSSADLKKSSNNQQTEATSGQVVFGEKETQYVGATHWAAILNDVRALYIIEI